MSSRLFVIDGLSSNSSLACHWLIGSSNCGVVPPRYLGRVANDKLSPIGNCGDDRPTALTCFAHRKASKGWLRFALPLSFQVADKRQCRPRASIAYSWICIDGQSTLTSIVSSISTVRRRALSFLSLPIRKLSLRDFIAVKSFCGSVIACCLPT